MAAKAKFTPEQKAKIAKLVTEGCRTEDLARRFAVSRHTIVAVAKEMGVKIKRGSTTWVS